MPRRRAATPATAAAPPEENIPVEPPPSRPPPSSPSPARGKTDPTPRKTEGPKREVDIGDETFVHHMFVSPVVGLAAAQIPARASRYHPTDEELDAVFRPLERVAMRRLPVDLRNKVLEDMDPDKRDIAMAAGGLLGYATRVFITDFGTPIVTDGGTANRTTGKRRGSGSGTAGRSTPDSAPPPAPVGRAGSGAGDSGTATGAPAIDPQAVASAIMSDLWRETYKGSDSPTDPDA